MKVIPRISITPVKNFAENLVLCLRKSEVLDGAYTEKFEKGFAEYIGVKHAIAVSSGRHGMELILENLRQAKTEIIVPSYTLIELIPILNDIGLKTKFVDIDENTFNINESLIEREITKNTGFILATHLFGLPCDMAKILRIAKKYNLHVVEDCTHALGSQFNDKRVGSFGIAGFFSFEVMKPINTFGGGMITTNDDYLAAKIRSVVKNYKFSRMNLASRICRAYLEYAILNSFLYNIVAKLLHSKIFQKIIVGLYHKSHGVKPQNFRFTNLQAKIGLDQLRKIDESNDIRIKKAKYLAKLLRNSANVSLPSEIRGREHVYYNFVIRVQDANKLSEFLLKRKIDAPIGNDIMQSCVSNIDKYLATQKILSTAVKLPLNNDSGRSEIRYVAAAVRKFFEKNQS